ncbi:MAG: hypothetical protein O3B65_06785 [Chloroflexi bacterium]|nr:hypothetical protein [Chloroflexota bacterium]
MGKVVALVGTFGAFMALFGALVAMFTGGVGVVSGVDEGGSYAGRALGAALFAVVGLVGAVVARTHLRAGASALVVSSVLGVLLVWWFYLVGAILMLVAAGIAFWLRAEPE